MRLRVFAVFSVNLTVCVCLSAAGHGSAVEGRQRPARTPDIFFTPTIEAVADAMLQLARVTADDVIYDLGSGDGRIVILAAQKYGARGVGIEIDPPARRALAPGRSRGGCCQYGQVH